VLRQALRMAADAAKLEPWNARTLALKGELHYFLKEDYESRTEASVARLRNPLEGLAYAVLALVSGLSTAEGTDWMKQALAADPYLRAAARPAGWPAFQRGALEPLVARWEQLRKGGDRWSDPEFENKIAEGETLFAEKRWDEAEDAFRAAQELQVDSHVPRLYLARIRRATGDAEGAANDLRGLAAEYPQEWEVWQEFGLALEQTEQFADAEEAFRHALDESPDEPSALFHLALVQMGGERWEAARNTLTILLEKNTRHGQAWLLLGTVETRLERWPEALHAYEQALLLDPDNEKARAGVRLAQSKVSR
jgi:tetratricopeptide (TPR) repeat protein